MRRAHQDVFRFYRAGKRCSKLPRAMIWYVSSKTGSDTGDGRALATAFTTLGRALDVAKAGDTVMLAPGTYDQDLPARVSAARAGNIAVAVIGSN